MRARTLGRTLAALAVMAATGVAQAKKTESAADEQQRAIELAREAYAKAKQQGLSFGSGPCLGDIMPGWVADVAHQPRLPEDNLPQNQCADYRSGKAQHYVELDPQGNVIRAK